MATVRFETILDKVGSNGRWQYSALFMISMNGMFVTFYNLCSVFIAFTPDHWCTIPEVEFQNRNVLFGRNWSVENIKDFALPLHSKCEIYQRDYASAFAAEWNERYENENVTVTPCESWSYDQTDFQWTLATEWNLVCQSTILASLLKSSYLAGILLGSLTGGFISDKLGRQRTAFMGSLLAIVAGIVTSFPTHYPVIVIFRTLVGTGCSISALAYYVLLAETTALKSRAIHQMAYLSIFAIGMMILPGIAYYIRDWTTFSLVISISSISSLVLCWFLPESPRWLILKGKLEDANRVLISISKINGKEVEKNVMMEMISECHRNEIVSDDIIEKRPAFQLFLDLFRLEMRKATVISYILWGLAISTYYAIIFNIPVMGNHFLLSIFLSGATEFPSYILGGFLLPFFGRRTLLSSSFVIGGIFGVAYLILANVSVHPWVSIFLAFSSKFSISIGFCVLYIYTTELFPTRHRHMALGTSSTCGRIGAIIAPFVVDYLGSRSNGSIVMGIYGIQSFLAGILSLQLPETKNKMLPETLNDVKHSDNLEIKTIR